MTPIRRAAATGATIIVALATGALAGGCGGDDQAQSMPTTTARARPPATPATTASRSRRPIPSALRTAESAAEDAIDLALAGQRAAVVRKARALKAVADGPAGAALHDAGASDAEIAEFRARASEVARLAPRAKLLRVALASNRAFGMVPAFFARFRSAVPAAVTELDHLDFEAKLQARAGDRAALAAAVAGLQRTWQGLRRDVVAAGGRRAAARFDAHVRRLARLAAGAGDRARVQREAQHGLDLVDELERVYTTARG